MPWIRASARTRSLKAAAARAQGKKVWWYICCGPHNPYANWFVEYAAIESRLLMGAMTAKYRPDGFLYYSLSIWNENKPIESGPFTVDTRSQEVRADGARIELTGYEYRVLECLVMRAGEIVSKSELTERVYEQDFDRDSNVIEVFIGRLRRKLDPAGEFAPIETLRGRGYRWTLARAGDAT